MYILNWFQQSFITSSTAKLNRFLCVKVWQQEVLTGFW